MALCARLAPSAGTLVLLLAALLPRPAVSTHPLAICNTRDVRASCPHPPPAGTGAGAQGGGVGASAAAAAQRGPCGHAGACKGIGGGGASRRGVGLGAARRRGAVVAGGRGVIRLVGPAFPLCQPPACRAFRRPPPPAAHLDPSTSTCLTLAATHLLATPTPRDQPIHPHPALSCGCSPPCPAG